MFGKTTLVLGAAAGYVLGSRAGRERYDQIAAQANKLWGNPKVQETVSGAQDVAKKQAAAVKDKATSAKPDDSAPSTPAKPVTPAVPATPATPVATAPVGVDPATKPTMPTGGTTTSTTKPETPSRG